MSLEHRMAPIGRTTIGKRAFEYAYWLSRRLRERDGLGNSHYEFLFTEVFGIARCFYEGKRILDVGCGPRGSLEWANMASERVGLDPLANAYRKLGTGSHSMRYVSAGSEQMPLPSGSFDVISCINALDHVENVADTISEMTRVAAPGATLLLIVDVNHRPTHTEPHTLGWDVASMFALWKPVYTSRYEHTHHGLVESLRDAKVYDDSDPRERWGVLVARLALADSH